jgi:hypothetical protein
MTGADTSLEVIEHLDFDAELPCEVSECPESAVWLWRCPRCSHSQALCGPHAEPLLKRRASGQKIICFCKTCKREYSPEDSPLEPIKGGK